MILFDMLTDEAPHKLSIKITANSNCEFNSDVKYSDIHPDYKIYDHAKLLNLKKWYESKNSSKFIRRKHTHIRAIIVKEFLKYNFVDEHSQGAHIKFNKKCIEYIKDLIDSMPFIDVYDLIDYIDEVIVTYNPIYDEYVDILFNAICILRGFSKWLKDNNLRIRMR